MLEKDNCMELSYPELSNGMSWDEFLQTVKVKAHIKTAFVELTSYSLADLFGAVEKYDQSVDTVMMNAVTYVCIRKWGRDVIDVKTNKADLQKGIMCCIWGAPVVVHKNVPDNIVIALSEPVYPDTEHFIPRLACILQLAVDTFPGANSIIQYYDRMKELSKEIQSLLDKSTSVMQSFITTIEKQ